MISTTYMPSMVAVVFARAGREGCIVCAGRERREGACLMIMRRTTDGKASLAGQSRANQSTQHRSKDRVHARLGQAQGV